MSGYHRKQLNELGMVSFTVTMIMILVISLIVIGFSEVTRRNQRQAIDRQLSAQAFYAAESGVNVTNGVINNYITNFGSTGLKQKTICSGEYDPAGANGQGAPITELSTGVQYSCVQVNPTPKSLIYNVSQQSSTVAPINGIDSAGSVANLASLQVTWPKQPKPSDTAAYCAKGDPNTFPAKTTDWLCQQGIIRLELAAIPSGSFGNAALDTGTVVIYLTPLGDHLGRLPGPASATITPPNPKAYMVSGASCNTGTCTATVKLPGTSASYYARMTAFYREAKNTTITGTLTSGSTARFSGSQAIIDVTGRAQDQLRRMQARLSLVNTTDSDNIPLYALSSSNDICKQFGILPSESVDLTGTGSGGVRVCP